jgi:Mn2+/Fe2+ NRAMP family transporter
VMIMVLASRRQVMGDSTLTPRLKVLGWTATAVMGVVTVAMFATF